MKNIFDVVVVSEKDKDKIRRFLGRRANRGMNLLIRRVVEEIRKRWPQEGVQPTFVLEYCPNFDGGGDFLSLVVVPGAEAEGPLALFRTGEWYLQYGDLFPRLVVDRSYET